MHLSHRWLYRSRQFFNALLARVADEEMVDARRVLGNDLYRVFAAMPRQFRRHGLDVLGRVREAGCRDAEVLRAALLHDSGKYDPVTGRYVMLVHKVVVVLLEALPGGRRLLKGVSTRKDGHGLLGWLFYPFYLSKHHARLGADLAAKHGGSETLVRLVRQHHGKANEDSRLRVLQEADERE